MKNQELLKLWTRMGVDLLLTADEAKDILTGDYAAVYSTMEKILREGRFQFDGNTYIPEDITVDFNEKHGILPGYNAGEPECDLSIIGDFVHMPNQEVFKKAQKCLEDNGIEAGETATVLQALFYILLDTEIEDRLE